MEIKVVCPCGAKYQFPVEPVDGHLPYSIGCPVCGQDNTVEGNRAIQEQLALSSPQAPIIISSAPSPVASPPAQPPIGVPSAEAAPAPPRVAAPALRISSPPPAANPPPPIGAMSTPPPLRAPAPQAGTDKIARFKQVGSAVLTVVLVVVGCYALYHKWSRRIGAVSRLVSAIKSANSSVTGGAATHWTIPDDRASVLLVKHPNEQAVGQALADFHQEILHRTLSLVAAQGDSPDDDFEIYAARKGTVEVNGPGEWPEQEAAAAAAALSKSFNTYVVMALMGKDGEEGIVSIYENGERRFRMKRWYKITNLSSEDGLKEFMERDGDAWAKDHGYVPGPDKVLSGDQATTPFEDVNNLVLKLGMDVSGDPENWKTVLVLKGSPAPAGQPEAMPVKAVAPRNRKN
jgi:hypothetical protein